MNQEEKMLSPLEGLTISGEAGGVCRLSADSEGRLHLIESSAEALPLLDDGEDWDEGAKRIVEWTLAWVSGDIELAELYNLIHFDETMD